MRGSLFFLLFIFVSSLASAQKNDSVRLFVDSALNLMQRHSMFSARLDWKKIRSRTHVLATNASTYSEAGPALKFAFNQLGDKHGWLVLDDTDYRNPRFKPDTGRVNANMKEAASKGPRIYIHRLSKYIAYISIPFFGGQSLDKMNAFAQRIQDSLCKVTDPDIRGIILDLRLNAGGNIYPMIVGIGNIYGKQPPAKNRSAVYEIKDNSLTLNDTLVVKLQSDCGDFSQLPVAVITGPVTGSSGEFLAIAFSTRRNTRLFGERTAGYTTANNGFLLPGRNNGLVLGESYARDANGKIFTNGVVPTVLISGGDDFFHPEKDRKIRAALAWLSKQKK